MVTVPQSTSGAVQKPSRRPADSLDVSVAASVKLADILEVMAAGPAFAANTSPFALASSLSTRALAPPSQAPSSEPAPTQCVSGQQFNIARFCVKALGGSCLRYSKFANARA